MDISSIFIYLKDLLATVMILVTMMFPAFGDNGKKYEAENPEELIMSFSAVSDTHIETNNTKSFEAFRELLKGIKAGENHDAAVYLGDNVMNGQLLENIFFYTGVRAVKPSDNNLVVLGNHDIGNGNGDFESLFQQFYGFNKLFLGNDVNKGYYYRVINGCYMIVLSSEELTVDACIMSQQQLDWLKGVLDEAKSENAPIFVFNHHPLYSLEGVEADALAKLLSDYDKLLYIHGHTHYPFTEESFNTENGVNTVNLPRSTEVVDYEPGDGIVVEVYEDEILVRGRDFIAGEWIEGLEYRYPFG